MKKLIDLSRLNIFSCEEYNSTEFYPKNYILAAGSFKLLNKNNRIVEINISIMKVNETKFTGYRYCVRDSAECRARYKNDKELDDDYDECMFPEIVMVSLCHVNMESTNTRYEKTFSYISDELETITDIINCESFLEELELKVNKEFL